ncbi:hypothetical protein CB1_001060001 [Camelus ferus]|nr:hypothetical protein CB1_001060001 [Camelus ferus]
MLLPQSKKEIGTKSQSQKSKPGNDSQPRKKVMGNETRPPGSQERRRRYQRFWSLQQRFPRQLSFSGPSTQPGSREPVPRKDGWLSSPPCPPPHSPSTQGSRGYTPSPGSSSFCPEKNQSLGLRNHEQLQGGPRSYGSKCAGGGSQQLQEPAHRSTSCSYGSISEK